MREYAKDHTWNPETIQPPPLEMCREFEHEGLILRVSFTRTVLLPVFSVPSVYVLSISKRNAVPDSRGYLLPTEEEGLEVARAFFPDGNFERVPDEVDRIQSSLKYYSPPMKELHE